MSQIMRIINLIRRSIFAGIAISMGCVAYLIVGGLEGAVLFAFGLLMVTHYTIPLYTGRVGFMNTLNGELFMTPFFLNEVVDMAMIVIGNLIGCFLTALAITYSGLNLSETVSNIYFDYTFMPSLAFFIRSIFCGIIMTVAVRFASKKEFLPLLFGVPLFIMCGFVHSIAYSFYMMYQSMFMADGFTTMMAFKIFLAVIGNGIGCNLYRLFYVDKG